MNYTDERYEVVMDVYKNHREEFQIWARLNGMEHYNKFHEAKENGETLGDLAVYLTEQFIEWKRLKDSVMGE